MATTTNKQKLVSQLFTGLGKLTRVAEPDGRPVLEQFLYAICREGVTREVADKAYLSLKESFFDWNEVRVSSVHELSEALEGLPDAEARAQRVIDFLQEVFETTFSFDLEPLHKKGVKQAAKQLSRYQSANDYATAWVIQNGLGGHALPLDGPSLRALRRLGLIEEETGDLETIRAGVEHQIPKARGAAFVDLISVLADELCLEADPVCPSCPLHAHCPTAQEKPFATAGATTRQKPR